MNNVTAQLFILPFAGGGKSSFRKFGELFSDEIEVITIEYPGRESRAGEPCCNTISELVLDSASQIENSRNHSVPYVIMGYSMGCEVAFELAQNTLKEKPAHVIFCARESIEFDTQGKDYALLDDEAFAKAIIEKGGVDKRIASNPRFLEIAMRPIRADYVLLHNYMPRLELGKLEQDITVFYSDLDTPKEKVLGWEKHSNGITRFYELGDNHFFINQCGKEMAEIINSQIKEIVNGI